jgi:hypothetical protein
MLLAAVIALSGMIGSYECVDAAEIVIGAGSAEILEFLFGLGMTAGIGFGLSSISEKTSSSDWDYGDILDDPATQKQIDETQQWVNDTWDNTVRDYMNNHGSNITPTPAISATPVPGTTPIVTVAPVDPDDVDVPLTYDELKDKTLETGVLTMDSATLEVCQEVMKKLWNKITGHVDYDVGDNAISTSDFEEIKELDGYNNSNYPYYLYVRFSSYSFMYFLPEGSFLVVDDSTFTVYPNGGFYYEKNSNDSHPAFKKGTLRICRYDNSSSSFDSNLLKFNSSTAGYDWRNSLSDSGLPSKDELWVTPDLVDAYNKNGELTLPDIVPSISLPSFNEIVDFIKDGDNADDDDRPNIVQNFITNHYYDPDTDTDPDSGTSGNGSTKPDTPSNGGTDPDTETDPSVDPDLSDGSETDSSVSPTPAPDGDGDEDEEGAAFDGNTVDLRLVFPFCIPFDLIHLIEAFDADPEAPVFEFPIDLELNDPFTGAKILDYHDTFVCDMSDFDDVIKIFRILEIIAFIGGLILITRQNMIKG